MSTLSSRLTGGVLEGALAILERGWIFRMLTCGYDNSNCFLVVWTEPSSIVGKPD